MYYYHIYLTPKQGNKLRSFVSDKYILNEINGIGELNRGLKRQIILTKPQFRVIRKIVVDNNLDIVLPSLRKKEIT